MVVQPRKYDSEPDDPCEWDPQNNRPALTLPGSGCQNPAAVIVGANGKYRLCGACAALPFFGRFKKVVPVRR